MKVIIDRFEEDCAVVEILTDDSREMLDIKKESIPNEAKEGDVLDISKDCIRIDFEETEKRKKEIEELTQDLWG